jgi:hypothetical protein
MIQALVIVRFFVDQSHYGLFTREDHALHKEQFCGHGVEVTNCKQGIFQVVEKAKAENQVKLSRGPEGRILRITLLKNNFGKPTPCFLYILLASIDSDHQESKTLEKAREMTEPTANVDGGLQHEWFDNFR